MKIEILYHNFYKSLSGLRFYDKNHRLVISIGNVWNHMDYLTSTELLEEGERIIGFNSKVCPEYEDAAYQINF